MSLSKNKLKLITSLDRKKIRDQEGLFVVEGHKSISEFVGAGMKAVFAVCTSKVADSIGDVGCSVDVVEFDEMKKVSLLTTPSQALAIFPIPRHRIADDIGEQDMILVLDGIQDPGNLGTIVRICSWFGIDNILCSIDTVDCYNPKVVQATMGSLAYVAVHYVDLVPFLAANAVSKKLPVYGTFLDGNNIYGEALTPKGFVVMGNEGNGICEDVAKYVDNRLFIPNFANKGKSVESLNVSSATSIIVSEFRRRRF